MCARWGGDKTSPGKGQCVGDSTQGGPTAAGHTPRLEQWEGQTKGALRECGREIWRNRERCDMLWGLSFPAVGRCTTAGRAASGEGHSRASLGRVPGSAEKWAERKPFAGGVDNVCSRILQGEAEGWLQKGTQFLSGAHLLR